MTNPPDVHAPGPLSNTLVPRLLVVLIAILAVMVRIAAPTSAASQEAVNDLVLLKAAAGEIVELASFAVDAGLVGSSCELTVAVDNQKSVNPGNDVIVTTGADELRLFDVEAAAGLVTSATGVVVPSETVVFTLVMGPREVFSGRLLFSLDCVEPSPVIESTTTTTTTTTGTTAPSVQVSSITTTTVTSVLPKTRVEAEVAVAPAAVPVPAQPTFTG